MEPLDCIEPSKYRRVDTGVVNQSEMALLSESHVGCIEMDLR